MVAIRLELVVADVDAIVVSSSHYKLFGKLYPAKTLVYQFLASGIYCSDDYIFDFRQLVREVFILMVCSSIALASSCLCFEMNLGGTLDVHSSQAVEYSKHLFRNHPCILAGSFRLSFQRLELQSVLLENDPWSVIL